MLLAYILSFTCFRLQSNIGSFGKMFRIFGKHADSSCTAVPLSEPHKSSTSRVTSVSTDLWPCDRAPPDGQSGSPEWSASPSGWTPCRWWTPGLRWGPRRAGSGPSPSEHACWSSWNRKWNSWRNNASHSPLCSGQLEQQNSVKCGRHVCQGHYGWTVFI